MNKKLKALSLLTIFLSQAAIANECDTPCEPCEQTSPFCGGYVGANFNFGSVNFLSNATTAFELDVSDSITPQTSDFLLLEDSRRDFCLREALNAVGGGVTLGWSWANTCWYLAAELNGLFYGNPTSTISDNSCQKECTEKCCGYVSVLDSQLKVTDSELIDVTRFIYQHRYKNNVRIDGIAKFGFLLNPNTALYILGGGSGLLIQYSNTSTATGNFTSAPNRLIFLNNPDSSFCCNKWIGGGTVGAGLKSTWCNCLDVILEARYAKYQNACYLNNKINDVSDAFQPDPYIEAAEFSNKDNTKFKTDSYMGLIGLNWRF